MGFLRRPLNPVLARELKERMRRRRAAVVLSVYLLLLTGTLWLRQFSQFTPSEQRSLLPSSYAHIKRQNPSFRRGVRYGLDRHNLARRANPENPSCRNPG